MRIIDLSQPIHHGCPNCPVHPPVSVELIGSHAKDGPDGWHMERINMASHTGSHLDAPLHKIQGGKSIDQYPLEAFAGPTYIVDLLGIAPKTALTDELLAAKLPQKLARHIVLLATGWGLRREANHLWHYDSPYLDPSGARLLVERGIKMVGIDHYSIGGSSEPANSQTHEILLSHDVLIVEDLHLTPETIGLPQPAEFMAMPIHFQGFSGSFCRPIIIVR